MSAITAIINSIKAQPRLNPTEIYNEGWMTRLLVYYSVEQKLFIKGIDFGNLHNWTSEGLISSPFVFAKTHREGYTHADMALGDFAIDYKQRGEILVNDDARLFGIIEAKMGSNLSQGTTTVPKVYNQASRNVACIATQTFDKNCEIFFGVVAPKDMLDKHNTDAQIALRKEQIEARFKLYENTNDPAVKDQSAILTKAGECTVWSLSFEGWINAFDNETVKKELSEFYLECRKWNRLDK